MRIEQYLDQVMAKRGLKRDKQLAEWLGVTPVSISNYRAGERFMDNEKCLKLALELEIDPLKVIMATDLDKADKAGSRSVWEIFLSRTAATAGAVMLATGVNVFLTPPTANAATMRVSDPLVSTGYRLCEVRGARRRRLSDLRKRTVSAWMERLFGSTALMPTAS